MVDLESKIGAGGGDQFVGIWVDYRGRGNRRLGICSRPKPAVVSCTEESGEVKVGDRPENFRLRVRGDRGRDLQGLCEHMNGIRHRYSCIVSFNYRLQILNCKFIQGEI